MGSVVPSGLPPVRFGLAWVSIEALFGCASCEGFAIVNPLGEPVVQGLRYVDVDRHRPVANRAPSVVLAAVHLGYLRFGSDTRTVHYLGLLVNPLV